MSEKMFKAGQSFTRAYKKFDDFANKGLITSLKERFKKKKTPVLSKSKELVKFDSAKALPSKLSSVTKKAGKFGKLKAVGRVASRVALPLTLGIEGANLAYKVATLSPEKKAKVKKLKKTLSKKSTKQSHADLLKMNTGGDTMGLKPIPEEKEKSLGKLPKKVRNKMGFEKDGGIMKAYKGDMAKGYGAARTQGEGLQDENLIPGKSLDYYKDIM
jgi:hypothetical protein